MPCLPWRRFAAILAVATGLLLCGRAMAAEPLHAFNIPRQPLGAALVALATQAEVTISTAAAAQCAPQGQPVLGRLTLDAALTRMLAGTGCGYRMIDTRAVEIVRSPAPKPPQRDVVRAAPPPSLDTLIVVATRRPTRSDSLAYAVSALDGRSLSALGVHDAGDLALTTPSMTVTNLGAGRDKILIRGLSDGPLTGRTQSMVGLYLDDVRLTYNAPDPDLRLVDMAQVEVLRGPQGALYGAGSLGGILQLVTIQPQPGEFSGWISTTRALTRGGDGSGVLEGAVNLPFMGGRGAVRLVGYHDLQGGYINDAALGLTHVNRTVRDGGRLTATLQLSDRWTVSGGLVAQAINSDDTQYALAGQPPYTRRNQVREPHDNDFAEAHISLRGDLDGAEAHWTTALVRHRLASRYDASSMPPVPVPAGPAAFDDDDAIVSLITEATLTSKPTAPIQWLAGIFYSRSRQDVGLTLTSLASGPVEAFTETRQDHLDEGALFGEAVLPLTGDLSVTLGGRGFTSDTDVRSAISEPLARTASSFAGGMSHSGFAPKIVLAYSRSRSLLFYAQAAEGYRSAGVNTTGATGQVFSPEGGPEPNRFYQGDELWSFEAGVRASALDGRLVLRSAVFQAVWKNIQSDQLLASGLPFTANIGDGRNTGFEFEGGYSAGELLLRGNLLINGPELNRANPAFPARADLGLAGVPGAQAGASAHYAWRLPQGRSVEVDGRYAYVGASHLTFDAVTSPRMGGYSTGRIAAALADDRWRLTLAVDNPADARGDTFAYGNPFTLRTTRQVTPLRPRTISLSLRMAY
ncbi:MAG: TonB-dependent receptor plug [Phenylobacterium sp.]|nr:TonB-dependent receptor plug [Phenylobacterium sp.]